MKNILVATDFSDSSQEALRFAQCIARAFDATIHLLHVVPSADPFWSGAGVDWNTVQDRWMKDAERHLEELDVEPVSQTRVTRVGEPYVEILDYAKQHEIELIVLGTHGRGPVGEMLLGSVADRVIRTAPCPVLTVRETKK